MNSTDASRPAATSRFRYLSLIGVGLYAGIIWYIGWSRIAGALARIDVPVLLAMAATIAVTLWLRAFKWRLVLGPGKQAAAVFFLSKAAGGASPGRVGELAPLLIRTHRTARMGAWILLDRLLEAGATIALGIVGLSVLQTAGPRMTAAFLAAFAVLVVAPLFVITRRALFLRLADRFSKHTLPHKGLLLAAGVSDEIRALRSVAFVASAITVVTTCLDLVVGYCLYLSFGYKVSFALLAVTQCAHGITSVIPFTPNATGVPYLVAASLIYKIGGVPEDVLAASAGLNMAVAAIVFWTSFALAVLLFGLRRHQQDDQAGLFDYLAGKDRLYDYPPAELAKLAALVPNKGSVLDLGCGDGAIGAALGADRVTGVEISPRCARLALTRGVQGLVADGRGALPFAENAFDTVYCIDVLHHLPGCWPEVAAELDRVLRPGGTIAIVEPDAQYAFVRWTQAPWSPIRVAPCPNEPALYVDDLLPTLRDMGYDVRHQPIRIDGAQVERSVFPMWQRLLKAPFVLALVWWHGARPNKFCLIARKPPRGEDS